MGKANHGGGSRSAAALFDEVEAPAGTAYSGLPFGVGLDTAICGPVVVGEGRTLGTVYRLVDATWGCGGPDSTPSASAAGLKIACHLRVTTPLSKNEPPKPMQAAGSDPPTDRF